MANIKLNPLKPGDMRGFTVNKTPARGYLLVEIIVAMGIAAALLGLIFGIASGSMSLGQAIVTEGRSETRREAFLGFLGRSFEQLPGNAVIELTTRETSQRFLPRMVIQNAPTSFAFDGLPVSAQAIVLTTVPVPSGGVNVVLEYYEEPLLDDEDELAEERQEPAGSIILYRDIWRFELRVLDSRTLELISDWDIAGRLPLQVELNAVFEPQGEEVIHYFWIPPKTNPSSLVRGLEQGNNQNSTRAGQTGAQNGTQTGAQTGGGNTGGPSVPSGATRGGGGR